MAIYTRNNAWNEGGTFSNQDLHWYASGVRAMMARNLNDPASWWFFAAIHGEYISPANAQLGFPGWQFLPGPPAVPATPLPAQNVIDLYWNQCQHQSWFFVPWHRGYLSALEKQLRADIVAAGGPVEWALPYWNYLGAGNSFDIPPAFTAQKMLDGSANPLFVTARYGPYGNNIVFDPTTAGLAKYPPPSGFQTRPVDDGCLNNTIFSGSDANTPSPGFGGPVTPFSHGGGNYPFGNLESDPHNSTHVFVGGQLPSGDYGLMYDPGLAALDPIFYLHHANIDRMWAIWNHDGTKKNPTDLRWLKGPAAKGANEFIMPLPGGQSWIYIPAEVDSLAQMDYTYDDLPLAPHVNLLAARLINLGLDAARAIAPAEVVAKSMKPEAKRSVELMGANAMPLEITGASASTTVRLDPEVRQKTARSLVEASVATPPDRVYLNLENVRGTNGTSALNVFIDLPVGAKPSDHPELLVDTVALFGLRRASTNTGRHQGAGLCLVVDVTPVIDKMHLDHRLDVNDIRVTLVPTRPLPQGTTITVGRISLYREAVQP